MKTPCVFKKSDSVSLLLSLYLYIDRHTACNEDNRVKEWYKTQKMLFLCRRKGGFPITIGLNHKKSFKLKCNRLSESLQTGVVKLHHLFVTFIAGMRCY